MTATRRIARPGPTGVGALTGLLLGAVILGPALAPGYTLHYDLVHVPDLALDAGTLGTDGGVPRAVPNDLLVALMSLALPGWVVQKVLLLGSLVVGAAGAGRLAATREDIVALAKPVMRHRLLLSFAAEAEQVSADDVIAALLRSVPLAA